MTTMGYIGYSFCVLVLSFYTSIVSALAPEPETVPDLQKAWAQINYELTGDEQLKAFEALIGSTEKLKQNKPDDAGILIWSGIIESTYAGAKGGLTALKYAKLSKKDLEKALEIDPEALQGSAYTSLGTLYYNVPGWPIGFGDEEKAEQLLKKALQINPDGIDPNYFYGLYLMEEGEYAQAVTYLHKAEKAPRRVGRALADAGRKKEIASALRKAERKLH